MELRKTKLTTEEINELFGVDDSWKAPEALMKILFDRERREKMFRSFLAIESDVSYDWFYMYFQDEAADRKKKKQDFTPLSISRLLSRIVEHTEGISTDSCAGTGGLIIQKWQYDRMQFTPMDYFPSEHFYHCEDLSDRAMPFLLFNLLIRGMNACVVHCDVLTRESKGAFFIQNDNDDPLQFSSFNVIPYTNAAAKELGVTWKEKRYLEHVESPEVPRFLEEYEKNEKWKAHQHKIAQSINSERRAVN